jgi:hypothetical protein
MHLMARLQSLALGADNLHGMLASYDSDLSTPHPGCHLLLLLSHPLRLHRAHTKSAMVTQPSQSTTHLD